MYLAQSLRLIGLVCNISGGFWLWKHPLMLTSKDNEAVVVPNPEEIRNHKKMTKIGMGLMTIGFIFQFFGNLF